MADHSTIDHTGITGVGGTPSFVGCSVTRTTDQTGIATITATAVVFNGAEDFDTNTFHDVGSNPSRITIPSGKDGKYLFGAYIIWDTDATGFRRMSLYKNGSPVAALAHPATIGTQYTQQAVTFPVVSAVATDYFEILAFHNSGANRTISGTVATCRFTCQYLGA